MSGSTNAQKTWFGSTQNRFAEKKIASAVQLLGKSLPARVISVAGSIVTVEFPINAAPFTLPQVTIPVFGPEYIRYPIQPGCLGVVFPVDTRIGFITGLGSGVPDLTPPANLSALVFFPVGNANWSPTDDANATVLYGPNGVILRTQDGTAKITVNDGEVSIQFGADASALLNASQVKLTFGANSITIDADGVHVAGAADMDSNLAVAGNVAAGNGITCSFTTPSGQTVTVQNGIVTNLV